MVPEAAVGDVPRAIATVADVTAVRVARRAEATAAQAVLATAVEITIATDSEGTGRWERVSPRPDRRLT